MTSDTDRIRYVLDLGWFKRYVTNYELKCQSECQFDFGDERWH